MSQAGPRSPNSHYVFGFLCIHCRNLLLLVTRKRSLAVLVCLTPFLYVLTVNLPGTNSKSSKPSIPNQSPLASSNASFSYPSTALLKKNKLPLIDRTVLDKLDHIQSTMELDFLERLLYIGLEPTNRSVWPPIVTAIPEPKAHPESDARRKADMDYCGFSPCRLLLPSRIAEQESKARQHFLQLLQLSHHLNRSLVLPNAGRSRLGACMKSNFDMYYDAAGFQTSLPKIQHAEGLASVVLSMDTFQAWLSARRYSVTSEVIFVDANSTSQLAGDKLLHTNEDLHVRLHTTDATVYKRAPCFKTKFKRLFVSSPFSSVSIHLRNNGRPRSSDVKRIMDVLSDEDIRWAAFKPKTEDIAISEPDVLVVDWDLRHPLFTGGASNFDSLDIGYAPHLHSSAEAITAPLRPYLAIHWRLESVPLESLRQCAHSLVDKLVQILSPSRGANVSFGHDIKSVWMATDYPYPVAPDPVFEDSRRRSSTFKTISSEHVEAMNIFTDAFRPGGRLDGWRLADLNTGLKALVDNFESKGASPEDTKFLEDEGVMGILDKIIAIDAELFVSGTNRCGRLSSFTKQIVDARKAMMENEDERLRNIVELFGS